MTRLLEGTPSWLASLLIHMLALIVAALIFGGPIIVKRLLNNAPSFTSRPIERFEEPEIQRPDFKNIPPIYDPGILNSDVLSALEQQPLGRPGDFDVDSLPPGEPEGTIDSKLGGNGTLSDFNVIKNWDPVVSRQPTTGPGPSRPGTITGPGTGDLETRGTRGKGTGSTQATEFGVIAALNWIARHQETDGHWSLDHHGRCKDASCTGSGSTKSNAAGTALGLLPFFAAGQTHQTKGTYQRQITAGVAYLLKSQKPTGDYSGENYMYAHGLATIAMSEVYGMSHDSRLRESVLAAVRYIEAGQDPDTGGWWYNHMQRGGDTSVVGWQVMGLKSAHMAGVQVKPASLDGVEKWFGIVGKGQYKGQFSYRPESPSSPNMTAVGLLCTQYLGAPRGDVRLQEGTRTLMQSLPSPERTNFYYWYYGSQVMHNMQGPDWDTWNRAMRRVLIDLQEKNGCATGSWDPAKEPFGKQGGRLFVTSLATLTLEVYYRYLPLYRLDEKKELDKLPGKFLP